MHNKIRIGIIIAILVILASIGVAYAISFLWVSISPTTPPGGFISSTSTNVAFVKFIFTNMSTSTEPIVINKLAITNYGTSSSTPKVFSKLYLYEENTYVASTTSSINNNTFIFKSFNYVIPTSTYKFLTIKGDLGAQATSSQTIRLGINNANAIKAYGQITGATTTITGYYPIIGNTFTIY